jgi:hypothetical protein
MQQSGMFSGTDVVSRASYFVDVLQFDAKFTGGSNALSYDEMVVFVQALYHTMARSTE